MHQGLAVLLGAVAIAGAVLMTGGGNKSRYQIVASDTLIVYRLDTFTGSISACMMNPIGFRGLQGGVHPGDDRYVISCGDPSKGTR